MHVYSEKEYPFPVPAPSRYDVDEDGNPIILPRDDQMWVSKEWLERHGYASRA